MAPAEPEPRMVPVAGAAWAATGAPQTIAAAAPARSAEIRPVSMRKVFPLSLSIRRHRPGERIAGGSRGKWWTTRIGVLKSTRLRVQYKEFGRGRTAGAGPGKS